MSDEEFQDWYEEGVRAGRLQKEPWHEGLPTEMELLGY